MLIFMMIFAIIAVDFFRDFGRNGTYRTIQTYGASDARWGQGEGMNWSPAVPFVENVTYVSSMTTRQLPLRAGVLWHLWPLALHALPGADRRVVVGGRRPPPPLWP